MKSSYSSWRMAFSVEVMVHGHVYQSVQSVWTPTVRGRTTMRTIFGMGLLLLWILTLTFAASINEDGTILDRGPLGSLFAVKKRYRDLIRERSSWFLATLHAAIINGWVWLQVDFEGAIFAGRMRSAKTSKYKRLENKRYTVYCNPHVHALKVNLQIGT